MPTTEPSIIECPERPYVARPRVVTIDQMATVPDVIPGLFEWLAARGGEPAGPPFIKYNVIDMARTLDVEAGVPTTTLVSGGREVISGTCAAGRYLTCTHTGHPQELLDVTARFLAWAAAHDLEFDVTETDAGTRWGCRLEIFKTNPTEIPDWSVFQTELQFLLKS
jgi:effector-binding domain-containing protein